MSFHVGQKVCCIAVLSTPTALRYIPNRPVKNGIYTVRAVTMAYEHQYLFFEEIKNPPQNWLQIGYSEPPFWHGDFRPIVSRKTDISALTALLVPGAKIRETA